MATADLAPRDKARGVVRWLLAGTGSGYVVGALFGWVWPTAACGLLAFVALAGYVVLAPGPAEPRLRRPLVMAALILAVVTATEAAWSAMTAPDFGWVSYGSGNDLRESLDILAEQTLQYQRWWAAGMLLVAGCLALAVRALPYRRQPRLAVVTAAVALLLLGVVLADLADVARGRPAVATAVWLPVLAALVALATGLLATQRVGGRLVVAGAALMAVPLLLAAPMAAWAVQPWPTGAGPDSTDALWSSSIAEQTAVSVSVATVPSLDPFPAVLAAAMLAGPVLVVFGCLRTMRQTAEPGPTAD